VSNQCTAGKHDPAPGAVRNQGFEFSHCRRCGRDLIRSNAKWTTVPAGFRVVWRRHAPTPGESSAQLLLNLPATGRALAPAGGRQRPPSRLATALEALLIGLRYAAGAALERVRAWRRTLGESRPASGPVAYLPAG
jgi:hypothetical protein